MDWRRRETYGPLTELPRKAWAWEFLRRNPDFHGAWRTAADQVAIDTEDGLTVITVPEEGPLRQWGVLFRRCIIGRRDGRFRILGPRPLPARPPCDCNTGATVVAFKRVSAL